MKYLKRDILTRLSRNWNYIIQGKPIILVDFPDYNISKNNKLMERFSYCQNDCKIYRNLGHGIPSIWCFTLACTTVCMCVCTYVCCAHVCVYSTLSWFCTCVTLCPGTFHVLHNFILNYILISYPVGGGGSSTPNSPAYTPKNPSVVQISVEKTLLECQDQP